MSVPRYTQHCDMRCFDRLGRPRDGVQYVHLNGKTLWLCDACSESEGRAAGLPTRTDRQRALREEARSQMPLLDGGWKEVTWQPETNKKPSTSPPS